MKITPFKKYLLNEQDYFGGADNPFADVINKELDKADKEGPIEVEVDGDQVENNTDQPLDLLRLPDGTYLRFVDLNGNGVFDEGEFFVHCDEQGNPIGNPPDHYVPSNVLVQTPDGEWEQAALMTYTYANGVTVAYANGTWQVVSDYQGNSLLVPGLYYNGTIFVALVDGSYYVCWTNPIGNPNAEWWNPMTGQSVDGGVGYSEGWNLGVGFGTPFLNYSPGSLLPFMPNPDGDGEWSVGIGGSIEFSGPEGQGPEHWNAFWDWYFDVFGEYPPQNYWPKGSEWWEDWWNGDGPFQGGQYEWEQTQ